MSKISSAPEFNTHRSAVTAADSAVEDPKRGVNCRGFDKMHVQVTPTGGANPSVEVLFWHDGAVKFISEYTPVTKTGKGADTPYSFTVDVQGRRAFVAVTAIAAGSVDISVAGWRILD